MVSVSGKHIEFKNHTIHNNIHYIIIHITHITLNYDLCAKTL